MAEWDGSADTLTEEEVVALACWRQGDYTLQRVHIPVIMETSDDEFDIAHMEACGWAVISQTCDIVNFGNGKEFVSICPIVEAYDPFLKDVKAGVTPAAAKLEHAPSAHHVVDLGRTVSVHKRALLQLERRDGFTNDASRSVFSQVLERRFGRFAFPDWLSNGILRQLRKRARETHKTGGDIGNIYKAIDEFRVRGNPDLESNGSAIGFYAVVDPDKERKTSRLAIQKEFATQVGKVPWPDAFVKEDELLVVLTLDEMTARQLKESHSVDLDFVSYSHPDAKN